MSRHELLCIIKLYLPAVNAAIGLIIDPPHRQLLPPSDERTKTAYGCEFGSTSLILSLVTFL